MSVAAELAGRIHKKAAFRHFLVKNGIKVASEKIYQELLAWITASQFSPLTFYRTFAIKFKTLDIQLPF